jgi:DNA polymerase III subunit delta'
MKYLPGFATCWTDGFPERDIMKIPANLDSFIGNAHSVEIVKRAIVQDRLPHAMIFAGPQGVGKCTLALLVAQQLNCLSPVSNTACGHCSACKRIMAISESRYLSCKTLKDGFCGTCPNCQIRTKRHPDIRLIEPDEKSIITIDQVRDLINEIAFQPAEARYRVVIFDPAGEMQAAAQNSLLKTLEEPASRTVLILITANPYSLLQTIRSRSRMLQFGEISHESIERYLIQHAGMDVEEARLAAAISGGSLGTALNIDTTEYRDVRSQALQFVSLLLKRGRFVEVSNIAVQVTKEKDKELFQLWIETVSALLQDVYFCGFARDRVAQLDLIGQLQDLARSTSREGLVRAINAVGKLKRDLQYNVNRQLAVEAMFVALGSNSGSR